MVNSNSSPPGKAWPWSTAAWLDSYAKSTSSAKGIGENQAATRDAVDAAFKRVYRAVAFDIDGTLTTAGDVTPAPELCRVIRNLLIRGVPVVLVTGRGRDSAREAARVIRGDPPL